MKIPKPKKVPARVPKWDSPDWEPPFDDEPLLDADTQMRKEAHEACKEFGLPDFLDQNDFD